MINKTCRWVVKICNTGAQYGYAVPRDPLVQSWCTKEQPYARVNLEPIIKNIGNPRRVEQANGR